MLYDIFQWKIHGNNMCIETDSFPTKQSEDTCPVNSNRNEHYEHNACHFQRGEATDKKDEATNEEGETDKKDEATDEKDEATDEEGEATDEEGEATDKMEEATDKMEEATDEKEGAKYEKVLILEQALAELTSIVDYHTNLLNVVCITLIVIIVSTLVTEYNV